MSHSIEERLFEIEERNNRVEMDKAWETSMTRRLLIVAITYAAAAGFLYRVHPENMWIDAVVPCGGYILSTLSLPALKKAWIARETGNGENESEDNDNF